MTVIDPIKILDDKIKSNQTQYNSNRQAAEISALSSKDLLKYLTGEDLGHRPSALESLSILPWVRHLGKHLKKITLKVMLRA